MQNDFENKDFWVEKDQFNKKRYYIRMYGKWIEITKEVYAVYKNSYQKMYRMLNKESDLVDYYGDIDIVTESHVNPNLLDKIWIDYMKEILHKALTELTEEEKVMIYKLFYEEVSERQLASKLGISKTTLHYRKKKIINKLRQFLDQNE